MRFPWVALALALSLLTDDAQAAQVKCKQDACQKVINGNKRLTPSRKQDCSAFLATTVTPAAKTIMKTKTVTKTTTVTPRATKTNTVSQTITETKSLVVGKIERGTTTKFTDKTFTTTKITGTVTVTAPTANAVQKRAARPTPGYASVCGARKAYSSACVCAGVQAKTITAARPTLTGTTTKTQLVTVTGKPTFVATRQVTTKVTTQVTKTSFTTVTQIVATSLVTRTRATTTVRIATTETVQPPDSPSSPDPVTPDPDPVTPTPGPPSTHPQPPVTAKLRKGTVKLHGSNGFFMWLAISSPWSGATSAYHMYGKYPHWGEGDVYSNEGHDSYMKVVSSPDHDATEGFSIFHDPRTARFGGNGARIYSFIVAWEGPSDKTDSQAFSELGSKCIIEKATGSLQCEWREVGEEYAEWWLCGGTVALARFGTSDEEMESICDFGDKNTMRFDRAEWIDEAEEPATDPTTPSTTSPASTPTPEPEPQTPSPNPDYRRGKLMFDQAEIVVAQGIDGVPDAYKFSGGYGGSFRGDIFEWRREGDGILSLFNVADSRYLPETNGLNLYFDIYQARFGPNGGATRISTIAAWKQPEDMSPAHALAVYGLRCAIYPSNDVECYWGGEDNVPAEFFWCSGYIAVTPPNAKVEDLLPLCPDERGVTMKPDRVYWVDVA